jgi:hypothetical protein
MARNRTAAVANQVAYDLGYRGVNVSQALLQSQVQDTDETEFRKRREVLLDRVSRSNFHHWTLVAVGFIVFGLALYVDYAIIHEFWSRLLSNEFGEVPPSMANTVAAKSAQVLFATLAIHYVISLKPFSATVAKYGRWAYSTIVFVVAFAMLMGIGIIWANSSMPEGSKVFAAETTESSRALDQFSQSMGIAPAAKPEVSKDVAVLREHETAIRLVSLSVIFIIVASIGAISLDGALRAYSAWSGGAIYDHHEEAELGRRLNAEYASFAAEDPSIRRGRALAGNARSGGRTERSTDAKINEFLTSYTAGVVDSRLDAGRTERLLSHIMTEAAKIRGGESGSAGTQASRLRSVS